MKKEMEKVGELVLCSSCAYSKFRLDSASKFCAHLDTEEKGGKCDYCGEEHEGNGLYTLWAPKGESK